MKILLVGEIVPGGSVGLIYGNLIKIGVETELIDISKFFRPSLANRIINKLVSPPHHFGSDIKKINGLVRKAAGTGDFDFILFIKPIFFSPETIKEIKKYVKVVSWYPDHVDFPKSGSAYFYKSIPLYDLHLSCIRSNTDALLKYGAKRSLYLMITADPSYHHPVSVTNEDRKKFGADAVFIGTHAPERRVEYLEKLCEEGYDVLIYGNSWNKLPASSPLRRNNKLRPAAMGDDMAKVMGASKIVLAFMREHNKEEIGCRTFEIPLCGGFMLHERTGDVKELLDEGREAEFFDSYEEMKEKIDFYLPRPELRKKIVKAGRDKVLKSGWLIRDQAEKLIRILKGIGA